MLDGPTMVILLGVGAVGGFLGGFLGIGGSVLFIPVLTVFMASDYHTAQAAALVVNVCVGFSAAQSHVRSGLVSRRLLGLMLPFAVGASVVGVLVSNQFTGEAEVVLRRVFGGAMVLVIGVNAYRMARRTVLRGRMPWRGRKFKRTGFHVATVGTLMGAMAGLLGIGGGSVAVPAMQVLLSMRLRTAVANSSVAVVFACVLAAAVKHATMPAGIDPARPWMYVGLLVPTAIVGAWAGAYLSRRVWREWVRLAFMAFLTWTAYRMLTG